MRTSMRWLHAASRPSQPPSLACPIPTLPPHARSYNRVYSGDKALYDSINTPIKVPCTAAGAQLGIHLYHLVPSDLDKDRGSG